MPRPTDSTSQQPIRQQPTQPSSEVTIRDWRPDDVAPLAAWEQELFGAEAWSAQMLAEEYQRAQEWADRTLLLAETPEGDIAAYAAVWHGVPGGAADVLTIATTPAHRRRGYARLLLGRLIATARTHQASTLMLEVRASNTAAQELYLSCGFRRLGVRRRYYRAPIEDAQIMSLELSDMSVTKTPGDDAD